MELPVITNVIFATWIWSLFYGVISRDKVTGLMFVLVGPQLTPELWWFSIFAMMALYVYRISIMDNDEKI